jgi:hypothetical protein
LDFSWNTLDFSWNTLDFSWNTLDFSWNTWTSAGIHGLQLEYIGLQLEYIGLQLEYMDFSRSLLPSDFAWVLAADVSAFLLSNQQYSNLNRFWSLTLLGEPGMRTTVRRKKEEGDN